MMYVKSVISGTSSSILLNESLLTKIQTSNHYLASKTTSLQGFRARLQLYFSVL